MAVQNGFVALEADFDLNWSIKFSYRSWKTDYFQKSHLLWDI